MFLPPKFPIASSLAPSSLHLDLGNYALVEDQKLPQISNPS